MISKRIIRVIRVKILLLKREICLCQLKRRLKKILKIKFIRKSGAADSYISRVVLKTYFISPYLFLKTLEILSSILLMLSVIRYIRYHCATDIALI